MASSKNNLTAVHLSLLPFVMLSVGLGSWAYVSARDLQLVKDAQVKVKKDLDEEHLRRVGLDDQLIQLKALLGYDDGIEVGIDSDPPDANSMLSKMSKDIANFGGSDLPQQTFSAAIAKLQLELANVSQSRQAVEGDLQTLKLQYKALDDRYTEVVDQFTDAQKLAEAERANLKKLHAAAEDAKKQQIQALKDKWRQEQNRLSDLKADRKKKVDEKNKEIDKLIATNKKRQDTIDEATKVSFEKADGVIHWVDNVKKRVWINVGESDRLPKRTNFSVYTKTHRGVGRDEEDIKGAIEVTRLIGPHLAEARILQEDKRRPMMKGDPIYTPLWSPGHAETFALVGLIDIDGDRRSDRELLHDIIKTTGSTITTEVDDKGKLLGEPISVQTKFLVVGEIPDPVIGGIPSEKKIALDIGAAFKDLRNQARKQGIRRVKLSEFLKYIGYRPQRRLWRPGDQAKFTLKAGAHSTAVNETVGDRSSSGQVSRAYTPRKNLKQESSTGQTSKAFGGRK